MPLSMVFKIHYTFFAYLYNFLITLGNKEWEQKTECYSFVKFAFLQHVFENGWFW